MMFARGAAAGYFYFGKIYCFLLRLVSLIKDGLCQSHGAVAFSSSARYLTTTIAGETSITPLSENFEEEEEM